MKRMIYTTIALAGLIVSATSGMDISQIYTLHTQLESQDRHAEQELANSLLSIQEVVILRQRIYNPTNLGNPPRFLATHYISKGLFKALVNDAQKGSEQSQLLDPQTPRSAAEQLVDEPLEQDGSTAYQAAQHTLGIVQGRISKDILEKIIRRYTGAFTIIAATHPALYATALCWAVSCNSLTPSERRFFDDKCYHDCAQLLAAYKETQPRPCCTLL